MMFKYRTLLGVILLSGLAAFSYLGASGAEFENLTDLFQVLIGALAGKSIVEKRYEHRNKAVTFASAPASASEKKEEPKI